MSKIQVNFDKEQRHEGNYEIFEGDSVFVQFISNNKRQMVQCEGQATEVNGEWAQIQLSESVILPKTSRPVRIIPVSFVSGVATEVL